MQTDGNGDPKQSVSIGFATTTGPAHLIDFANPVFRSLVGLRTAPGERVPLVQIAGQLPRLLAAARLAFEKGVASALPEVRFRHGGEDRLATVLVKPLPPAGVSLETVETTLGHDELPEANRSTAQLRGLLQNLTEAVVVFDAQGQLELTNAASERLLELPGPKPTLSDYLRCELRRPGGQRLDAFVDLVAPLLAGEPLSEERLVLVRGDGSRRHLLVSGSGGLDETGRVGLAIQVFRDVTAHKELEIARAQFLSLVTHDLRGPLSAARMATRLLERPDQAARHVELAGRVIHSLDRMDEMLRSMLDADRLRSGSSPLRPTPCDLAALTRDVVDELASVHGPRFLVRGPTALTGVWNGPRLQRALWNLLANAVKYGTPDSPVLVTLEETFGQAHLTVHNDGAPIPPEELQQLFSPFSRTATAQAGDAGGWGLGLTQVQTCAEAHGGTVRVRSEPGYGTDFVIELPLDSRLAEAVDPAELSAS